MLCELAVVARDTICIGEHTCNEAVITEDGDGNEDEDVTSNNFLEVLFFDTFLVPVPFLLTATGVFVATVVILVEIGIFLFRGEPDTFLDEGEQHDFPEADPGDFFVPGDFLPFFVVVDPDVFLATAGVATFLFKLVFFDFLEVEPGFIFWLEELDVDAFDPVTELETEDLALTIEFWREHFWLALDLFNKFVFVDEFFVSFFEFCLE